MSDSSRGSPGFEPERRTLVGTFASLAGFVSSRDRQILEPKHPQVDVSQRKRISAGWISVSILHFRVLLSPVHAQRQREVVMELLRPQDAEVLILLYQLLQRAAVDDLRLAELLLECRPRLIRRARLVVCHLLAPTPSGVVSSPLLGARAHDHQPSPRRSRSTRERAQNLSAPHSSTTTMMSGIKSQGYASKRPMAPSSPQRYRLV